MIDHLYTDKERQLPLIHSKQLILQKLSYDITDICNTSTIIVKKERGDSVKVQQNEFFAKMVDKEFRSPMAKKNMEVDYSGKVTILEDRQIETHQLSELTMLKLKL
jgi:hypothetical protein